MFSPYLKTGFTIALLTIGAVPIALAQTVMPPTVQTSGTIVFRGSTATPAPAPSAKAILAEVSAEAGIPFQATPSTSAAMIAADSPTPPLCVRAGVGVAIPVLNTPVMTMEHGIVGCPTETAGMPFLLTKDPDLQPPLNGRTGDYNLDVTVRYRLMQMKHMQLLANASAQAIGYALGEPITGNNVMLSVSLVF